MVMSEDNKKPSKTFFMFRKDDSNDISIVDRLDYMNPAITKAIVDNLSNMNYRQRKHELRKLKKSKLKVRIVGHVPDMENKQV